MSSESGPCAHMCRSVEEATGEKIGAWRRINRWLMSGFLLVGRSCPGAPGGGVVGWRWSNCRKIFLVGRRFWRRQRVLELLVMRLGWLMGNTTPRWVAGKENTAKPLPQAFHGYDTM